MKQMTSNMKHNGATALLLLEYYEFLAAKGYTARYKNRLHNCMFELVGIIGTKRVLSAGKPEVFQIIDRAFNSTSVKDTAKAAFSQFRIFSGNPLDDKEPKGKNLKFDSQDPYEKLKIYVYEERQYNRVYSSRILRIYNNLNEFLMVSHGVTIIGLNEELLLDYIQKREGARHRSFATSIRLILRFLFREEILSEDMSHLIITRKRRPGRSVKYFEPEVINAILEATPRTTPVQKRDFAMFMLMARMGLRVAELFDLQLQDFDWIGGKLRVLGKGGKIVWIPLNQEAADAVVSYLKVSKRGVSETVFVSSVPPFERLSLTKRPSQVLRRVFKSLNMPTGPNDVRTNVFRHSFATQKLNEGNSIMLVRDLLRHENVAMTQVYAKYSNVRGGLKDGRSISIEKY